MQTDELRAELAELAREVDAFPEELGAIRKRVARRRAAQMSVAAVLIVGLIAGAIATTRSDGDQVRVAGHPKQTSIKQLPRVDALVALRSGTGLAQVQEALDSTGAVAQYARIPRQSIASVWGTGNLLAPRDLRAFARRFAHSIVVGVELDVPTDTELARLNAAVGKYAQVANYAQLSGRVGNDVEIFMNVRACAAQIDAIRVELLGDSDVASFRYLSKADAFTEFKRLFHDEPTLIGNTTADALPTSFRLTLRDRAWPTLVANRYAHRAGVRSTSALTNPFADQPTFPPESDNEPRC